eukprot:m.138106 g.138106  ORF g.138106 m.138106 type:complete len:80 (-) comp15908_c5_seq1:1668-1907(-)
MYVESSSDISMVNPKAMVLHLVPRSLPPAVARAHICLSMCDAKDAEELAGLARYMLEADDKWIRPHTRLARKSTGVPVH